MYTLYIILAILIIIFVPFVPFFICHFVQIAYYFILDTYKYFKYKRWNECKSYGQIITYNGLFGQGKTLSVTSFVRSMYNRYNGKLVYDFDSCEWVEQKIHIVSNYHLNDIPYIPLISEKQMIDFVTDKQDITIFVLDEIGAIFNNRDYKNFTPDLLTSMLQCRKRKCLFLGTSQRFQMQDKNFRTTMEKAYQCRKIWRFCKLSVYDAYQLENCSNPLMLKPLKVKYWFVKDTDYNSYNTDEMVTKLCKDANDGLLLTSSEISQKNDSYVGSSNVSSFKRRFRKNR